MENQNGVMLGREQLMAADFASTDETRHGLTVVHVTADGTTEATNGHFAIRVPGSGIPAEDFPEVAGKGSGFNGSGLNVPAVVFRDTLKSLPKRSTIPILAMAHLGAADGGATITTTDLETSQPRTVKAPEGQFPDLDRVMPVPDDTGRMLIGIDAHYLKTIAEYAIKVASSKARVIVNLSVKVEDDGICSQVLRVDIGLQDGRKATVALMPCRVK